MNEENAAIISKIKVGVPEYAKEIMVTISFKMKSSVTSLVFSMKDVLKMMNDINSREDINDLIGEPCQIFVDDKNTCHFKGMWIK